MVGKVGVIRWDWTVHCDKELDLEAEERKKRGGTRMVCGGYGRVEEPGSDSPSCFILIGWQPRDFFVLRGSIENPYCTLT